jgi:hypothetical protein
MLRGRASAIAVCAARNESWPDIIGSRILPACEFIVRFADDQHMPWAVPLADDDPEESTLVPGQ